MEKEGEQVNKNGNDLDLNIGNDATQQLWNNHEDATDALLGDENYANADSDDDDHDEDYNPEDDDDEDEDYIPDRKGRSKRVKRHTRQQIEELKAAYEECAHPDARIQRALAKKIGLEPGQVKTWFQNQRSLMQKKAQVEQSKLIREENASLRAENLSLRQALSAWSCVACRGETVPVKPSSETQRLLTENARLKDEHLRASAVLDKIIREAPPPGRPAFAFAHPVPWVTSGAGGRADRAALLRHAETAMKQFLTLATNGEPMWRSTAGGEVLNHVEYDARMSPRLFGLIPQGFAVEATRDTAMVKGSAADLVSILTDTARWSEMFPGVVASVTAGAIVSSGSMFASHDGLIQLLNAELYVQSPRVPNRSVNFLRFSKLHAERQWAVMDVSIDGIIGQEGCRMPDLNLSSSAMPARRHMGCRLLPSGCLIEDMSNGYCKITWIVHAEYNETTVPTLFKPLLLSGQAFGARRWLASLQRQCEYLAVLRSSRVPGRDITAAAAPISAMGRRGTLELSQRMMASFYAAISGPVTQASSNIDEWHGSTGTGAERFDAAVRMVTKNEAGGVAGDPAVLVLSASTTVWLPNTPPQLVFEYLCNEQRRGEWDTLGSGAAVKKLGSVATGHLDGNVVSVLSPNFTDASNSKMLILQEACTDASCSLLVYAPIDEKSMRAVMDGGDHASLFLVPSGFAILPDGHCNASRAPVAAPSTSSAPVCRGNTTGSLLTVAYQALLPGSPPGNDIAAGAFDNVGKLTCRAIKKIKAAVKADIVLPA